MMGNDDSIPIMLACNTFCPEKMKKGVWMKHEFVLLRDQRKQYGDL